MNDLMKTLSVSASGMQAQADRIRHVSENIANTDTPGYQRKMVAFEEIVSSGANAAGVQLSSVTLDRTAAPKIYDPSHPLADASGHYEGSNVDLILEIADAREAQRSYEANLRMFDQAKQMSQGLLDLLRR